MNQIVFAAGVLLFPAVCTTLGAAGVFLLRRSAAPRTQRVLSGMAAGIMLAASVWSLLLPAIERTRELGVAAWVPPSAGLVLGAAGLLRLESMAGQLLQRGKSRMVLAVTLHNLPEGMVVGLAAALALSVVVMLAAFVGFGGAKVRGKYNEARQWFTTGVSADNGYALSEELTTRANTAANIITTGANTLGADSAEVQAAQAALDDFSACLEAVQNGSKKQSLTSLPYYQGSAMHALCQANDALGTVIDQLYAKMQEQAADPMKMGAVQGQYGQFNSADTIIGNLQYNDAVYEYQNDVGGFPASMLGRLFGVQEVEPFA